VRSSLLALLALLSQSCFSARYVAQAARGQYDIARSARPIVDVVADGDTPARTRRMLAAVGAIKRYGQLHGLKPTKSYERYADLRRPAAVWVVQACAPLSFEVKRWSFPVVGSVPYLGFFDEGAARRYAGELSRGEALDVDVRTASAFSTLGWFRDPILSTMLGSGDEALGELANVVLHESVHATVYVKDQSAFDESLASFVADRLTPAALEALLGPGAREAAAWGAAQPRDRVRVARLHEAYVELDALYRSTATDAAKRAGKARILGAVQEELHLARPLNNAALAGYRAYDSGTAAFERLRAACEGSWPRLLAAARTLTPSDFARPQQPGFDDVVDRLARERCGHDEDRVARRRAAPGAT
jgi:predicted aminopeptidase